MIPNSKGRKEAIEKLKNKIDLLHKLTGILKEKNKHLLCNPTCNFSICSNGKNVYDCQEYHNMIEENVKDEIEILLNKLLPHGSGIDCEWKYSFHNNGNITCKNEYHAMNDAGYYIKWIPISIKFFRYKKNVYHISYKNCNDVQIDEKKDELDFKIYAPSQDYYAYNLKDYLYQTMDMYFENFTSKWLYKVIKRKYMKVPFLLKK